VWFNCAEEDFESWARYGLSRPAVVALGQHSYFSKDKDHEYVAADNMHIRSKCQSYMLGGLSCFAIPAVQATYDLCDVDSDDDDDDGTIATGPPPVDAVAATLVHNVNDHRDGRHDVFTTRHATATMHGCVKFSANGFEVDQRFLFVAVPIGAGLQDIVDVDFINALAKVRAHSQPLTGASGGSARPPAPSPSAASSSAPASQLPATGATQLPATGSVSNSSSVVRRLSCCCCC
jgi:hypothetical protein